MDNQRSEKIMEEYREEVSDLRRKSYPKMSLNEAVKIASEYMLNHYSKEELKEAIINDKQMQLFGMEKSWLNALGKAKKMANGSTVKGGLFTIEKGVKLKRGDKLQFTDEKIHPLTYIEKEGQMAYTRHSSHPTKKDAERVSESLSKNFYNVIVPSKGEYVVYKNLFNTFNNGGGVAVSSESGLAVGTNADLLMNQNYLQYRNGGRFEFRNTISHYNKMKELYQTNRESLEEINDYVDENYKGKKEEFIPLIYSVFPTTIKELGLTKEDFVFWLNDPNYYQGYFSEDNIGEDDYARGGNMSSGFNYSIGGL